MADLIAELARIGHVANRDTPSFRDRSDCLHFLRTHHAEIAEAVRSLQRVKAMRDEWERDVQEHLCRFGQPLPASVECLIEKLDTAMRAREGEG
jgi:hypothetical protein